MNWKNITGILCAGIISGYLFLSYGAAFRELLTANLTISESIIYNGVLVLNFVLAVAIWDSGKNISTRENTILPISINLGTRWAQYIPIHSGSFHMQTSAV
jgi:hypothetical protein